MLAIHPREQVVWFLPHKGDCGTSYPGHVLWCAVTGGRGHRALQAAESARRPQGEVAPDRTTTSQSLQSERSNPLPVAPRPGGENAGGGMRTEDPGCQVGPVTASWRQNRSQHYPVCTVPTLKRSSVPPSNGKMHLGAAQECWRSFWRSLLPLMRPYHRFKEQLGQRNCLETALKQACVLERFHTEMMKSEHSQITQ